MEEDLYIDTDLECAICLSLLENPVKIGCGHGFCVNCLRSLLTLRCPLCRRAFDSVDSLQTSPKLNHLLEKRKEQIALESNPFLCNLMKGITLLKPPKDISPAKEELTPEQKQRIIISREFYDFWRWCTNPYRIPLEHRSNHYGKDRFWCDVCGELFKKGLCVNLDCTYFMHQLKGFKYENIADEEDGFRVFKKFNSLDFDTCNECKYYSVHRICSNLDCPRRSLQKLLLEDILTPEKFSSQLNSLMRDITSVCEVKENCRREQWKEEEIIECDVLD